MLKDVMLTIVFPLARHIWDVAAFGEPRPQWRHRHDQLRSSSTQSSHRRRRNAAMTTTTPLPPPNGRQQVGSTGRRHRPGHGDEPDGDGGGGGARAAAVQLQAAQEDDEGEEGEDGFEMVEAPDERSHSLHANAAASAPTLCREPSWGRYGWEGDGKGAEGEGDGDDGNGDDEVGLQPLSSPALLVLLLVLKSFLKHLSSLRRGTNFCDVWHEVTM